MEQWYTLHTKPNAEYQIVTTLQQRGIQTYLPEIEIPKARNGRKKKPFFPCYLFGKVDLEIVGFSQVQWIPGLRRIVSFGDQPVPMPNAVIDMIRRKLGGIETADGWPTHTFRPGDTVRITDGPFRNMLAIFDRSTTSSERVQVLLSILGHASRVQLSVANLKKVPHSVEAPAFKRSRRTHGQSCHINNC